LFVLNIVLKMFNGTKIEFEYNIKNGLGTNSNNLVANLKKISYKTVF